jgi:hypothetical protein
MLNTSPAHRHGKCSQYVRQRMASRARSCGGDNYFFSPCLLCQATCVTPMTDRATSCATRRAMHDRTAIEVHRHHCPCDWYCTRTCTRDIQILGQARPSWCCKAQVYRCRCSHEAAGETHGESTSEQRGLRPRPLQTPRAEQGRAGIHISGR